MNVKEAIESRRSVRKYRRDAVPDDLIIELLNAGRLAPSGNNAQPWAYRVLSGTSKRDELRKNKIFKQDFVYKAPVIIVCCADPTAYPHAKLEPGYDDSYESRAARDLSISSQNIVLRATELGLGTCYIGWMEHERIKTVLGIPDKYIVPFVITVGHPDEKPKATARKRISDIVL